MRVARSANRLLCMQIRARLTLLAILGVAGAAQLAEAQGVSRTDAHGLSRADSLLVGRLLSAEDRRDSTDHAIAEGLASREARVALIARRAMARMRDARFASRDSLGAVPAPPVYADPAWRVRYRALDPKNVDCTALAAALNDSAWHVRLHAADLVNVTCAGNADILATLRAWLPAVSKATRASGDAAWQPAAHALVALARMVPAEALAALPSFMRNDSHWVRVYAAHAAAALADTLALRTLARDANDNVKEAAIDALSKLTGHADDALFIAALGAKGYQAVRAGAHALKGIGPSPELRRTLLAATIRLRRDSSETSRDARTEVMARLSEVADVSIAADVAALASDFDCELAKVAATLATKLGVATASHCTPFAHVVPADAVQLAFGADVRLRVVMAKTSGGGSFVVRLRGDVAPIMSARIVALVKSHYYDGRAWHRVEPDFVIQGPSPDDNEYVGHPRFLRDELGTVPHVRGTVGMSTRGHDTGDSQWFVNLKDNPRLGRDYTVFGEIVEGIEIADGVLEGDVIERIQIPSSMKRSAQPSRASAARDTAAIEMAAAIAARAIVGQGAVFDDRETIDSVGASSWTQAIRGAIASAMGLALSTVRSYVDCTNACRLIGDASVYTLERPVITGDTAVVWLGHVFRQTIGRSKIGRGRHEIVVARRGGDWVFVRWGTVFST